MYKTPSGAFLVTVSTLLSHVVLEPEHLAYLLFVEPYDDFAVYDGGGGGWEFISTISCIASRSVRIFFSIKSMFL